MSRYRKVKTRMWGDEKFRQLSAPKPNAQTLWQYLLTGPYTTATIPGLINAGVATLSDGLGWPLPATRRCLDEITALKMAEYDDRARVIWLPRALQHNEPESPNVVRNWAATIVEIPDSPLKEKAITGLLDYLRARGPDWEKAWHEPSAKASPKASHKASVKPHQKPLPNQEQNAVTGTESTPPTPLRASHSPTEPAPARLPRGNMWHPPELFHHDCPEPTWQGHCVNRPALDKYRIDHPDAKITERQCPAHRST